MPKPAHKPEEIPPAVSRLPKILRRYFRIGVEAREVELYDQQGLQKLAKKRRVSRDSVLKARRFVEHLGDDESLGQLARPREKQKTPLGWAHIRLLVSVKNRARRFKLLKDAVDGSWSKDQLNQAIQLREGRTARRKAGGRPPTNPASIYETMLRLQRLSEKWSALYQLTEVPDASEKSTSPIKNRVVPATPKQQIRGLFDGRSASASQKLKVQVESLLKALKVQAVEIGEIVAAAEKWRARIEKTLPAKVKRLPAKTGRR